MKTRVISGTIIGIISVAAILLGGTFFKVIVGFVAVWGTYEFCSSRNHKIIWFEYIIDLIFIILINLFFEKFFGFMLCFFVALIILAIFSSNIDFEEISVNFLETILLGVAVYYMLKVEMQSKWFFGFIIMSVYLTDVFAYIIGSKYGKHKLCEKISPKKTIEGAIGGWAFGFASTLIYALIMKFFNMQVSFVILCSVFMPIMSQIGDLAFSLIKRHYNIKDFSNLIPGHGGLLDRLDSMIFVLLVYGGLCAFII